MRLTLKKLFLIIASGGTLLATTGCPTSDEIMAIFAGAVEDIANQVVGTAVSDIFSSLGGA